MTYDRKLLTASMNGDQQAFALLYDEIYPELYRMAIYMSGNVTIADDLVSETVLAAYQGINKLKSPEAFEAWIFKIMSIIVKRSFHKKYHSFSVFHPNAVEMDTIGLKASDWSDNEIIKTDLLNAISKLKYIDRLIISLCVLEGYSSREVGKILSMNAATVRSRLNRNLKKLKTELEEHGYE